MFVISVPLDLVCKSGEIPSPPPTPPDPPNFVTCVSLNNLTRTKSRELALKKITPKPNKAVLLIREGQKYSNLAATATQILSREKAGIAS